MRSKTTKNPDILKLFPKLDSIIDLSHAKIDHAKKVSNKLKWAKILLLGISTYGKLFEQKSLVDLEKRLAALEGIKH